VRAPDQDDVRVLAEALAKGDVKYAVIGGAAMAFHGFPRMTKDIDLLLPVDSANNRRLMDALKAVPDLRAALRTLKQKWLDEGYSTAVEGEINVDLLFVAADRTFNELREHILKINYDGVPVLVLDIDGMLMTKETSRESDKADRLKLERLKAALAKADRPSSGRKSASPATKRKVPSKKR
jgi:hypothetical protein